jgi:hypothetical protein
VNAKNLNKKIRRLIERIEKDTKKLAKLRLKLGSGGAKKKKDKAPESPKRRTRAKARKRAKPNISAERRAELSAAMKARWAAKRAAAGQGDSGSNVHDGIQPS